MTMGCVPTMRGLKPAEELGFSMTIELEERIDSFSRLVDVDYVHENNLIAD